MPKSRPTQDDLNQAADTLLDIAKIKRLRERLKLTQQQAADRVGDGFDRFRWASIETGKRSNVTVKTLYQIAKALDVKPAALLK